MSGISGFGPDQLKLMQQSLKASQQKGIKSKSGKLDSSFTISTNTNNGNIGFSQSTAALSFKPFTMTSFFSGSKMVQMPAFDGLSYAEPTITEDELRQAVIEMAQRDAANGIEYGENYQELNDLINRLVCGVSPDRKGLVEKGANGLMIPSDHPNMIAGEIIDDKTGQGTAYFSLDSGWVLPYNTLTKEERELGDAFYQLYNQAFLGKDTDAIATGSKAGSASNKVDYRA